MVLGGGGEGIENVSIYLRVICSNTEPKKKYFKENPIFYLYIFAWQSHFILPDVSLSIYLNLQTQSVTSVFCKNKALS